MLEVGLNEVNSMPILWLENTICQNFQNDIKIKLLIFEHFANFHHYVKN